MLNLNFKNIADSYLFSNVNRKVAEYGEKNPGAPIIRLGIGDVTLPLAPAVIDAMQQALCEMSVQESFRGYGPEQGYNFLKDAIQEYYAARGTQLDSDEIFISDGAKSDLGNILDLFSVDNTVLVPDPVYPVYVDTNTMAGRKILFMDANESNGFLPLPDASIHADIIYLCSPNNPTGAAYDRAGLKAWVDYANQEHAVILAADAAEQGPVLSGGAAGGLSGADFDHSQRGHPSQSGGQQRLRAESPGGSAAGGRLRIRIGGGVRFLLGCRQVSVWSFAGASPGL